MGSSESRGLVRAIQTLKGLSDDADKAIEDTIKEIAFRILKEAKVRAPVDTGFLENSGEVDIRDDAVVVRFGAKYALPVHERTEVSHVNGEAKFLENAVEVVLSKVDVLDTLQRRLG